MRNTKASPEHYFSFKSRHSNIQTYEINLQLSDFSLFLVTFGKKRLSKNGNFLFSQIHSELSFLDLTLALVSMPSNSFKIIVGFQMLCAYSTKNKKGLTT